MSDLLSIGGSGVAAYQRALSTVSNNIANVGTEGYVRQETALSETMPRQQGRVYLGTGTAVTAIKRAYDQFLETNLRNSNSDLNTQGPMVAYANRVVDILGSETIGLPGALDQFFATSRALSTDPSSTILRQQFLRDADGLAGRFRELSTQMSGVDNETRAAINTKVADINTLASQIAIVNKQLGKHPLADRQPPDLLDQRDLLLTKLSALVKVNVTTRANGAVDLSIGNSVGGGKLVDGDKAIPLEARFDEKDLSRVSIISDPYSKTPTEVVGVTSGELGGLMGFREQVLQPTFESLDYLTSSFANAVNAIHRNGVDADGKVGKDLFVIDAITRADAVSGETVAIDRPSAGIRLAIDDPRKIAAGSLFRVIEGETNLSGVDAALSYSPAFTAAARPLSEVLKNNAHPSAGIVPKAGAVLGQIPIGADNWSLYLDNASGNQNLQVFTRDGRQLMGASIATDAERDSLLRPENGFYAGTTYSNAYLNKSGEYAYKQTALFYGAQAKPGSQYSDSAVFTPTHAALPSYLANEVAEDKGKVIPADMDSVPSGTLTVNGKELPMLLPKAPATTLQASDFARWISEATAASDTPVLATASTEVKLTVADPTAGMYINGYALPIDITQIRTLADVRDYINTNMVSTAKVIAEIDADGKLVINNAPGFDGNDISIGAMAPNGDALGDPEIYKGQLTLKSVGNITLGYGPNGYTGALNVLGRPEGDYYTELLPVKATDAKLDGMAVGSDLTKVAGGTLTLNGKILGELQKLDMDEKPIELQASDMAEWLNDVGETLEPPVTVTAATVIRGAAPILNGAAGLTVNGISVAGPYTTANQLVDAINANTSLARMGVSASVDSKGAIVLENYTGKDIVISGTGASPVNALGVANGKYKGALSLTSAGEVKLGFAGEGVPSELAKLGMRTGVHIEGPVGEDLIVVMGGEGSGTVSGSYDASMADPATLDTKRQDRLRAQDFEVNFTTGSHYQVIWRNPSSGVKTIVAERDYDPMAGIDYQGLKLMLSNTPVAGDRFTIDGNQDGLGNNENINAIVALERDTGVVGLNGNTVAQAYENTVGKIGNVSSQAKIAGDALKVVFDQAVESRDKVSGVSLDSEAADLIRFQQAYQASAKTMQVASELFDAILQAAR